MFLLIATCMMAVAGTETEQLHQKYLQEAREVFAKRDPARWFITQEGRPTERLISLLKVDGLYDPHDGLKEIVAKTQKKWVQVIQGQGGKERADLQDSAQQQKVKEVVENLVRE
ncbi:MAG: hypothetical protein JSR46_07080, partial [Verrucomicrobia bacterium]|nr:hypothetical protein [Verrucomicrobiota bacterium]